MEGGQPAIDAVDQTMIDRDRNVRTVKRRFEMRTVLAGFCVKPHPLHVRIHHRPVGPLESTERREKGRHRGLTIGAIRQRPQLRVTRWIDACRVSVAERYRWIWEVRIREDVVD